MTYAVVIALAVILHATAPAPAQAQSLAECEAWLCLPAGFSVSECSAAEAAVRRRLRLNMDPLPSWASCASRFSWDAATLAWTMPESSGCPSGYSPSGGVCRRTDANGCRITHTRRRWANVWVWVDGAQTGQSLHHTISNGSQISRVCPPSPPTLTPPTTPISTTPPWESPSTPPDPVTDLERPDPETPPDPDPVTDLEEICLSPPCDEEICLSPPCDKEIVRQDCHLLGTCPPERPTCPPDWLYDHASGHCYPQLPGIEGVGP